MGEDAEKTSELRGSEGLTNRKPSRPARSLSMDDEDGQ